MNRNKKSSYSHVYVDFQTWKENNKCEKMMTTSNGTQKIKQGEKIWIEILANAFRKK
jgi:hypothetical protein